ncbi:FtsW/RodA/SpoVE family cell cycle protein [Bacillus luteolus]|uniref:Probable peptidoglycan glycosyltransferase FtsW n=1 Tax=Litchfieldia luteola TaxID=682179 RepID=A0ABR9QK52_9BACI|nr:FtsW/RodA/SpoVE family cell cycle protein [Cytobacillus luteolus]MBE4908870.1 FtsW/RodA/SpoVE family cell cycle protein [Cytobacillus luteolus]MBP1941728.1 cell division protein FtsW [Cytobacillus luteolus]
MFKKIIKSYDYTLLIAICMLCFFGLVMVYSSSMVFAASHPKINNPEFFYDRQKLSMMVGFIGLLAAMIFPYKAYASSKLLSLIVFGSIGMLLLVAVFGATANNAQSWLMLGTRGIQPSEFTKLSVIIYLAAVYAKKQSYINDLNRAVLPPILFTVGICFFVMVQPDIGTAFIISLIAGTIILCSGMGIRNIIKLLFFGLTCVALFLPFLLLKRESIFTTERISRFQGYLDPFLHEGDAGYQLINSYVAMGSGGITGLGLGQSIQKFGYLPEAHTDFIMAVIAEELGLFGVLFVIFLLAFIIFKGLLLARKCTDPFGSLLAIGISSMLAIQTFINLGGLTGLIPITGVTLPFISYGGSSMILLLLCMGILLNVSMFVNYEKNYKKETVTQNVNEPKFKNNRYSY